MSIQLGELISFSDMIWPPSGAESWDAPGLVSGDPKQVVSRVLLAVDVNSAIVDEAIDGAFDAVFAHHPFLMRGVQSVGEHTPKGALISKAVRSGVSIFAAHTNADIVEDGVSDVIAKSIGLEGIQPLVETASGIGHGRVGVFPGGISLGELARLLARTLPSTATGVRVAGDFDRVINRIALCGGAGDSFLTNAIESGADVYISSDLRHHPVQDAREYEITQGCGPAVIDVSHWASEWLWLEVAADQLSNKFPSVQFVVSHLRTDPWDFVITQ